MQSVDRRGNPRRTPGVHEQHAWVGAAMVGLGDGDTRRAEHAARTGRHVLTAGTRLEVLEVYCSRCRVPYGAAALRQPCAVPVVRAG